MLTPLRIQCPVCHSRETEPAVVTSAWTYLACQRCQHVWKRKHSRHRASDELIPLRPGRCRSIGAARQCQLPHNLPVQNHLRQVDGLPSQRSGLGWLANVCPRAGHREIELWRVVKGSREFRCVAVYLPIGIDLRLMDAEDLHRTELLKDGPAVQERAEAWRHTLGAQGWACAAGCGAAQAASRS